MFYGVPRGELTAKRFPDSIERQKKETIWRSVTNRQTEWRTDRQAESTTKNNRLLAGAEIDRLFTVEVVSIDKYFSRVPRRRISRVQQWKAPPRGYALSMSTSIVLRPSRLVSSRLRGSSPRCIITRSASRLRTFMWSQVDTYTISEHHTC